MGKPRQGLTNEDTTDLADPSPAAKPSCFSYGYISTAADDDGAGGVDDATLTHIQCHESAGFGEMFPYPPEAMLTASADPASNSTVVLVQPTDGDSSSSSSSGSTSAGAIVGAVIGVIALVCLAALAAFLLIRRRRQKAALEAAVASMAPPSLEEEEGGGEGFRGSGIYDGGGGGGGGGGSGGGGGDVDDGSGGGGGGQRSALVMDRLRPLSTIQEQTSPVSARTASPLSPGGAGVATNREKRKSVRRSFGSHWPLGSGNPLAAHPVRSAPLLIFFSLLSPLSRHYQGKDALRKDSR